MTNEESNILYREFVLELERIFGKFEQFQFKDATNAFIANELNYSNAQFSRLIHNTASHGELVRAVNAVKQLKSLKRSRRKMFSILGSSGLLIVLLAVLLALNQRPVSKSGLSFQNSFETLFSEQEIQNFYTKLQDLPANCDYPCYKYQGRWNLKTPIQIPLLREKSGFHIRISATTMYTACSSSLGEKMDGYELETMEIWYDLSKRPFDQFITTDSSNLKLPQYPTDFTLDPQFVRLGSIQSLLRHEFQFSSEGIDKKSNTITRNLELVPTAFSKIDLESTALQKEIEKIAFGQSARKPINCEPTSYSNPNFHRIEEGEELSFSCLFNIKNYGNTNHISGVRYTKTYQLNNQYITTPCQ